MLIPVFFGCESSNDLGIQYDLGTNANIRFEEFTLPATNLRIDSLRTDGENRVLIGNYDSPITGSVSAEAYLQYVYSSGPMPKRRDEPDSTHLDTLKLDSMVLVFDTQRIIPNQSSSIQAFSVFDLVDSLESSAIYLSNFQQTTGTFAGSFNQIIGDPEVDTVFKVKLEDSYAAAFYSNLSDIAGDTTRFISSEVFKSMGIIPDPGSTGIASIDLLSDSTRLIVYSSPVSPDRDSTYLTNFVFTRNVSRTAKHYTYLNRDLSGSEFDGIEEFVDFDLASGNTIMDPLSGITTAYSIAEVEQFFAENGNLLINNATISFEFDEEADRETLTGFLNYFRKKDGTIFGPALASNSFGNIVLTDDGYQFGQAQPSVSVLNENEDKIVMFPTLFFQLLYGQFREKDSLVFENPITEDLIPISELVNITNGELSLQRSIFKQDGVKLRLYYTEVEQ